jgi:alpha-N-arabinofuranosidase
MIRYPGGNFVSGFDWRDSVGPREERPTRLDLAWHSLETNQVGLHEFAEWVNKVGAELMLAVNLGTGGVRDALALLEYANVPGGSTRAQERAANGRAEPFDVRMWCLGNEMDGPWQIGHRPAEDYGKLASQTAKAMRMIDPSLQLVVCGSSSAHMPTFGEWERTVLTHTYDDVDYISCHAYYEERNGDLASFLASGVDMDRFIESVVATADHVKAVRGSSKIMYISFDEWNVWYNERFLDQNTLTGIDNWPRAPRILEDVYNVADAVVVGGLLISLLRHADRVTSASLAQLVNVIAPIMTEPGGPAWKQTTFYPFSLTSRLARGSSLKVRQDGPSVHTDVYGRVPQLDAAATYDETAGQVSIFAVNRSSSEPLEVTVDLGRFDAATSVRAVTLWDSDPYAANTRADPRRVGPTERTDIAFHGALATLTLPPASWTALAVQSATSLS